MERLIEIRLFGQPYTFKTDADAPKAKEIADFLVNEVTRVQTELTGRALNLTKNAIVISAALNIVNEYFELQKDHSELLEKLAMRSARLRKRLDDNLSQMMIDNSAENS